MRGLVAGRLVVERAVAAGDGLEPAEEVQHDLVERQFVGDDDAFAGEVVHVDLDAALFEAQRQDRADVFGRRVDLGPDVGLFDLVDALAVGHLGGVVDLEDLALDGRDAVNDRGRGDDQAQVELALQALLDDFHVEQSQEAAAEAEAQGRRRFGLVEQRGVVEHQLFERVAQLAVVRAVGRIETGKDHRLDASEARNRFGRRFGGVRQGVAHQDVLDVLDGCGQEAHVAGLEFIDVDHVGGEDAQARDVVLGAGGHELDARAGLEAAVQHAEQHDHALIGVVPAVEDQGLEGRVRVALGGGHARDQGFENLLDAHAGLGRNSDRTVLGLDADDFLDLFLDDFGLGRGQVDLVDDRDDLKVLVGRQVGVGHGLGFDALRGVHQQQRAFAGRHRARDFVGEVHVAGSVDQIEHIVLTVLGLVVEPYGLGLDGDALFALDVHAVEVLGRAGLDQADMFE